MGIIPAKFPDFLKFHGRMGTIETTSSTQHGIQQCLHCHAGPFFDVLLDWDRRGVFIAEGSTMRFCKCGNEIHGNYGYVCEDCWAMAQPFWQSDESVDVPVFDGRSEKLMEAAKLVAA